MRIGRPNTTPTGAPSVRPVGRHTVAVAVGAVTALLVVGVLVHLHQSRSATPASGSTAGTTIAVPAGAKTPKELYGRWVPRSWTDGTGSHDVHPPPNRHISLRFEERTAGPVILYEADCNGMAVANVVYDRDGAITFDPGTRTSEPGSCPDAWRLPALRSLLGPDGHLRYQLAGNTLTVENVSARVTFIATREG